MQPIEEITSDKQQGVLLFDHMVGSGFVPDDSVGYPMLVLMFDFPNGKMVSGIRASPRREHRMTTYPISQFLLLGDELLFPAAMNFDAIGLSTLPTIIKGFLTKPISSLASIFFRICAKLQPDAKNLGETSWIEAWVCEHTNPPFESFPFDRWLRLIWIDTTWLNFIDEDGRMWRLGTVALGEYRKLRFRRNFQAEMTKQM